MRMGKIGWKNEVDEKNKDKRKLSEVTFRRELKALQKYE